MHCGTSLPHGDGARAVPLQAGLAPCCLDHPESQINSFHPTLAKHMQQDQGQGVEYLAPVRARKKVLRPRGGGVRWDAGELWKHGPLPVCCTAHPGELRTHSGRPLGTGEGRSPCEVSCCDRRVREDKGAPRQARTEQPATRRSPARSAAEDRRGRIFFSSHCNEIIHSTFVICVCVWKMFNLQGNFSQFC